MSLTPQYHRNGRTRDWRARWSWGRWLVAGLLIVPWLPAGAGTLTNWARGGTASQVSTGWGGVAGRAIDGNISGWLDDDSITHTAAPVDNAWWEVDLKETRPIGHIHLWFRELQNYEFNVGLRVIVYDGTNTMARRVVWQTNIVEVPPRDVGWNIDPCVAGRSVRVEHRVGVSQYVSLAEVEVFNQPLIELPNFALRSNGGVASSSSVLQDNPRLYGPDQAIDGNRNGLGPGPYADPWGLFEADGSGADPLPWWQVKLATPQNLGSVVIWPRRDQPLTRYEKIELRVVDAAARELYRQELAGQPSGSRFVVNFVPALVGGQFVRIGTTSNTVEQSLGLAEVEVYPPLPELPTLTILSNLQPVTVEQNRPATFGPVVATVEGGIRPEELSYRWFRNGEAISGMAGSWLSALSLPSPYWAGLTNQGDRYQVQVAVAGHGVLSSEVALSVRADTDPPVVVTNYTSVSDAFYLNLAFNEVVQAATATDPGNYSLEGDSMLGLITLNPDGRSVRLMVLSFLQNESIALHVSGIKDLAGNVMEPALFTAPFSPVAVNYARLGVASQRDDPGWDGPAWKAIDGNTSGDNWCHTRNADNEWWEVDLKATRLIGSVRVFFRGGMNDRDANLDLVIYDKPEVEGRVELYRTHISSSEIPPNPSTLTLNPPVAGRVVRIEHPVGIAEYLCLSEVQVFPPPPRFWRTWWTVGLAVLGTTVVAGASVRLLEKRRFSRRMRVLEQQSALERERTRIAQDLHDEMGAKLCRISFLSENARRRGEVPEDLQNQIDSISSVSREVLRTLDQIVWAVNPKNDTLEHMASYIAHYAQDYFQMTGIDCEQDIPAGLPPHALSSQIRHHLFLVVQEAFSNILKHSKATHAKVSMALARDAFTIVISDNGAGFDGAATAGGPTGGGGNGLDNMRQRMHAIGGVCRVQSQPGQGTVVHVELALKPASPTH